jgi:heme o synthase
MSEATDLRTAGLPPPWLVDCVALAKPRITVSVIVATLVGFYLAHAGPMSTIRLEILIPAIIGTALVVAGGNAFNQVIERRHDARMARTMDRPLASGRLTPKQGYAFSIAVSAVGLILLVSQVGAMCTYVALAALVSYVGVYTPLKRVTPLAVVVGAVPGALPPLIGWAAATGELAAQAWLIFAIMFVWQLPHFHAIAWIYWDDYRRAGYPVLAATESTRRRALIEMVVYSVILIPVSLLPTYFHVVGMKYYIGALVLGCAFLAFSMEVARLQTRESARQHLWASLSYLVLLFGLMSVDKVAS